MCSYKGKTIESLPRFPCVIDGSARGDGEERDGAAGPHESHEVAGGAHVPRSDRIAIVRVREGKRGRRLLLVVRNLFEKGQGVQYNVSSVVHVEEDRK